MRRHKRFFLIVFLGICFFISLLFLVPLTTGMDSRVKDPQKQFKDYMAFNHINGIMLVNDKKDRPIVIENNETANKSQLVSLTDYFQLLLFKRLLQER